MQIFPEETKMEDLTQYFILLKKLMDLVHFAKPNYEWIQ